MKQLFLSRLATVFNKTGLFDSPRPYSSHVEREEVISGTVLLDASTRTARHRHQSAGSKDAGWVLMEALVAMVVLSVAVVALNRGFAEAVYTRAIARDYTQARFLLEQVTGELQIKPMHEDGASGSGNFGGDYPRFSYSWTVSKQDVPPPQLPAIIPVELQTIAANFQPPIEYLGKISVQVNWTRSGQRYSAELETAIPPGGIRIQEEADNAARL